MTPDLAAPDALVAKLRDERDGYQGVHTILRRKAADALERLRDDVDLLRRLNTYQRENGLTREAVVSIDRLRDDLAVMEREIAGLREARTFQRQRAERAEADLARVTRERQQQLDANNMWAHALARVTRERDEQTAHVRERIRLHEELGERYDQLTDDLARVTRDLDERERANEQLYAHGKSMFDRGTDLQARIARADAVIAAAKEMCSRFLHDTKDDGAIAFDRALDAYREQT